MDGLSKMPDSTKLTLILGSTSPRRKELLGFYGAPFEIEAPDVDENSNIFDPKLYVKEIAIRKAKAIVEKRTDLKGVIICSDTTVSLHGQILGKPNSLEEAREHLTQLSGSTHQVYTAIALVKKVNEKAEIFCEVAETEVEFIKIEPSLLERYLASRDAMDKAGSYGIQGQAQIFVKAVKGSYSNVVGFPHHLFCEMMDKHLLQERKDKSWLSLF